METTNRFNLAVQKLYKAYHNNTLNPECCNNCAVGNILNNTDSWKHLSDLHGSLQLNYLGLVHQNLGRRFYGYSPLELLQIEALFLEGCGYEIPLKYKNDKVKNTTNKEALFNGLETVITFLCELDGVPNIMDYNNVFNFNKGKIKNEKLQSL